MIGNIPQQQIWWRRTLALLVCVMGLANIASSLVAWTETHATWFTALLPLEIEVGSRHLAVVSGLALLAMGRGQWRGKRATWIISFVPHWRGVYLVYDSRLALPRVLYAVLKVHLPALGPQLVTEYLAKEGEHNLRRWRDWLRSHVARPMGQDDRSIA